MPARNGHYGVKDVNLLASLWSKKGQLTKIGPLCISFNGPYGRLWPPAPPLLLLPWWQLTRIGPLFINFHGWLPRTAFNFANSTGVRMTSSCYGPYSRHPLHYYGDGNLPELDFFVSILFMWTKVAGLIV